MISRTTIFMLSFETKLQSKKKSRDGRLGVLADKVYSTFHNITTLIYNHPYIRSSDITTSPSTIPIHLLDLFSEIFMEYYIIIKPIQSSISMCCVANFDINYNQKQSAIPF